MTTPIREISEPQACAIALEAVGYPAEEKERVYAVHEGTTEDTRFGTETVELDEGESDFCWIVALRPLEERGYSPDGPEYVIWIDSRTGNILKVLRKKTARYDLEDPQGREDGDR
ncbi:MAG TPA: PepSY domain-containing protein [Verrucomicrobiae bacterium]|jgi:hypothetical protein|nr:PepSY domain-containing protein [Verrucomicrobiae bacterium]